MVASIKRNDCQNGDLTATNIWLSTSADTVLCFILIILNIFSVGQKQPGNDMTGDSSEEFLRGLTPDLTATELSDERNIAEASVVVVEDKFALGSSDFILVDDDSTQRSSFRDSLSKLGPLAKERIRRGFSKKLLLKRLPVLRWLPTYSMDCAVGDLVSGITVGMTMIPQALAYANIAGLPPQYGLYSAFFGSMLYILFGSCKDVSMGPTAVVSLITYQSIQGTGPEQAIVLCFMTGLVMLLMGLLGLGFLLNFVSSPVSSGFTSALAFIIMTSQVKDLLGIPATGNTFIEMWTSIFQNIGSTRLWDTILGFASIVFLLALRHFGSLKLGSKTQAAPSTARKIINQIMWLVSVLRNAILVIVTGLISYACATGGVSPFRVIGYVPPGLPEVRVPPFSYTDSEGAFHSFSDIISNLGIGLFVLPFLAILEDVSVCKAFAAGKAIDPTQELIAIGLCNMGNSFVQGYPGTGGLARSAVFNASGVKTSMGNIYSGMLVIASLLLFTTEFYFIPKATLASIIVAAVIFMVEVKVIKPMWRCKKIDLIPCIATFIASLVIKIEIGIVVGIVINVVFILYQAARPKITMRTATSREGHMYIILTPDRCLIFPSVEYVRHLVTKHGTKQGLLPVVIDCSHIYGADFTAANVVQNMTKDFAARGQPLFFLNLKPSVVAVFEGLQPEQFYCLYQEDDIDMFLKEGKSSRV